MNSKRTAGILLALFFLAGCATITPAKSQFEKSFLKTKYFTLTTYYRMAKLGAPLNIYIEGDGHAWLGRTQLSTNPTPRNPLVLKLAELDPSANVAYLARPGQYTESGQPLCDSSYWSQKRFSEEVVVAMSEAIDQLCLKANSNKINLIGYSGGAAIAVLIASRRSDVATLRTVAGNLDPGALNQYHRVSPLNGSLDPMKVAEKLSSLPQRHFVGSKDTLVPGFIAQSFVTRSGDKDYSRITVVKGATHTKGWQEHWKELLLHEK